MVKNEIILSMVFSTMEHRETVVLKMLDELSKLIKNRRLLDRIEVLVVSQGVEQGIFKIGEYVSLHKVNSTGLSVRRNYGIKVANGRFVWFLDDDVCVSEDYLMNVLEFLDGKSNGANVITGRIFSPDVNLPYKDYSRRGGGVLRMLRISSIEIIAEREYLQNNDIHFCEEIGLGTPLPSGEENLFLISAYQNGAVFSEIGKYIVDHPMVDPNRVERIQENMEGLMKSKGIIAKKLGGVLGFSVMLFWLIKFSLQLKSFRVPGWLINGYLKGLK